MKPKRPWCGPWELDRTNQMWTRKYLWPYPQWSINNGTSGTQGRVEIVSTYREVVTHYGPKVKP